MKNRSAGRSVVIGLVAILMLGILGAGGAAAEKKIKFSLGWLPTGMHVGFFSALEKGYFRQEGYDVVILRGFGDVEIMHQYRLTVR